MIEQAIKKLLDENNLTENESYQVFEQIMEGAVSPIKTAAFLTLLRMKKEQPSEVSGAAKLLRDKAIFVKVNAKKFADTCGTGGDGSNTFNISTATAILAHSCGVIMAKHGNKSISSQCGSADVMEALGYKIDLSPESTESLLEERGFAFLYAPLYHKAMKNVGPVRKELGFRTIFNILGPLCNPCRTNVQLMGVSSYNLLKVIAPVFQKLGITGYVVCGEDGTDEITPAGKSYIVEVTETKIEETELYPQNLGLEKCTLSELSGGNAEQNAKIIKMIFQGKEKGARRDTVILNTAVILKAYGIAENFESGIELAVSVLDSGKAYSDLCEIVESSQALR